MVRGRRTTGTGSAATRCSSIYLALETPTTCRIAAQPRTAWTITLDLPGWLRSVVLDPNAYDWEGDRAAAPVHERDDRLRDARRRIHAPCEFRRQAPGRFAGVIEKRSCAQVARCHRRGDAASVRVRRDRVHPPAARRPALFNYRATARSASSLRARSASPERARTSPSSATW